MEEQINQRMTELTIRGTNKGRMNEKWTKNERMEKRMKERITKVTNE